jgi:hypothetical protein
MAALRDEAAAEIERLERESALALDGLRATATASTAPLDADARLAAARHLAADTEADEDWQDVVAAATDRDAWIAEIVRRGRVAIATAPDVESWTAALAREAVEALPGDACVLILPASIASRFGDAWREALERQTRKRIVIEVGTIAAGCCARTSDGRVAFDNSLEARERRAQTAWRAELAKRYDAAVDRRASELAKPVAVVAP